MGNKSAAFKKTELGSVPSHWAIVAIHEVGSIFTGSTPSTSVSAYYGGSYEFITPRDMGELMYVTKTQKSLTEEGIKVARQLPQDTVLVSCIGDIGKTAITSQERSATNQQINAVITNERCLPHFLYYVMMHESSSLGRLAGRTTMPIVNKSNFSKFMIPLPPVQEQRAIAKVLRTVQETRETRLRELQLERERKAALIRLLFTKGAHGEPTEQSEIGQIPESWKLKAVRDICDNIIDYRGKTPAFSDAGVIHLRSSNIKDGRLVLNKTAFVSETTYASFMTRGMPKENDVIFTTEGPLGESTLVPPGLRFSLAQRLVVLQPNPHTIEPSYLMYALYSEGVRSQYFARATGTTVKGISSKSFQKVKIPIPSIPEQRAISTILSACDRRIDLLERENQLLEELLEAMLKGLMSGQLAALPLLVEGF
ncbi:MAG: restriction endonuclease subunit S [Halobacteriota archaeon]